MRFFFALFYTLTLLFPPSSGKAGEEIFRAMAENTLIRLHVIANSDSEEDQRKKLEVRDAVLEAARKMTLGLDAEQAERKIQKNLETLQRAAQSVEESARVEWGIFPFPDKTYGGIEVPAGEYRAVRVVLGEGEGQNWWCILYPAGCGIPEEEPVRFESVIVKLLKKWGWLK